MGTAPKKKRPMKSHKSGVKKAVLIKSNIELLKKLSILVLLIVIFNSCMVVIPIKHGNVRHKHTLGRTFINRHTFQK